MPKRIVDGEAVWGSRKLRRVQPVEFRALYPLMLPLALANGVFECDPELIKARVFQCLLPDMTVEDTKRLIAEFVRVDLLRTWDEPDGKTWGLWVGIDKPGRLPGRKRWGKNERIGPTPPDSLQVSEPIMDAVERSKISIPKPKPEPKPRPKPEQKHGIPFDEFWAIWPEGRRVGKQEAVAAWARIPETHRSAVLMGLARWKDCAQWQDTSFIPYPHRFLNRKLWQGEAPTGSGGRISAREQSVRTEARVGAGPQAVMTEEARQKAIERSRQSVPQLREIDPKLQRLVQGVAARKGL